VFDNTVPLDWGGNHIYFNNGAVGNCKIKNNIFLQSQGSTVGGPAAISSSEFTNNFLYGTSGISAAYSQSNNYYQSPGLNFTGTKPDPYYRPLANGNLVDKGVNVGLAYSGSAPDIGAYEYISTTPPPAGKKGDINADGKVDIIDLGIFLSNWGSTSKPASDINQDGRVDVVDLGILLSNWG